jgi:hypothetical protein
MAKGMNWGRARQWRPSEQAFPGKANTKQPTPLRRRKKKFRKSETPEEAAARAERVQRYLEENPG